MNTTATKTGMGGLVIGLIVAGLLLVGVIGIVAVNYITYANMGVREEAGIKAQYEDNKNVLSAYSLKVKEALGITKVYSADFERVMAGALEGRYGENGSQAVMQWIQEAYPGQFDNTLYSKIQQLIEAGRNEFKNSQTVLLDRKRSYEIALNEVWSGLWLGLAGYPKIDLDEYSIVVSEHADQAFKDKIDRGIDIK